LRFHGVCRMKSLWTRRVTIDGGVAVVGVCSWRSIVFKVYVLDVSYVRVIYSSKWEEDAMLVCLRGR